MKIIWQDCPFYIKSNQNVHLHRPIPKKVEVHVFSKKVTLWMWRVKFLSSHKKVAGKIISWIQDEMSNDEYMRRWKKQSTTQLKDHFTHLSSELVLSLMLIFLIRGTIFVYSVCISEESCGQIKCLKLLMWGPIIWIFSLSYDTVQYYII